MLPQSDPIAAPADETAGRALSAPGAPERPGSHAWWWSTALGLAAVAGVFVAQAGAWGAQAMGFLEGMLALAALGILVPLAPGIAIAERLVLWGAVPVWKQVGVDGLWSAEPKARAAAAGRMFGYSAAMGGLLYGLFQINFYFSGRFNNQRFAAFVLAAVCVAAVAVAAVTAKAVVGGAQAALDACARRGRLPRAAAVLTAAAPAAAAAVWAWRMFEAPLLIVADATRPLWLAAAAFAAGQGVAWALARKLARTAHAPFLAHAARRWRVPVGMFGASCLYFAAAGLEPQSPVREAITRAESVLARPYALAAALSDFDGDGYSAWFGGGDCDGANAFVNPAATDIAGNGEDEDCADGDWPFAALRAEKLEAQREHLRAKREQFKNLNIVLITVDTLRADRLGVYGNPRPVSPRLDALARQSLFFQTAYSNAAVTKLSLTSILTGRLPSEIFFSNAPVWPVFLDENESMPEILKEQGYATGAVVTHWFMERQYNMHQGFDQWDNSTVERPDHKMTTKATSEDLTKGAIKMLDGWRQKGEKFFLWVHYFDPHGHYIDHPGVPVFGKKPLDKYDHEIAHTDRWMGALFDYCDAHQLTDQTAFIITADHGEAFGEHGYTWHGQHLYNDLVRVPLMVRVPGVAPQAVATNVSNLDIMPTVLDLAGIPDRLNGLRGKSLLDFGLEDKPAPRGPIVAEVLPDSFRTPRRSIVDGPWKLIYSDAANLWELYDVTTDPGEKRNLALAEPEVTSRLKRSMKQILDARQGRLANRFAARQAELTKTP